MALRGAAKIAFLERMARGRRKASLKRGRKSTKPVRKIVTAKTKLAVDRYTRFMGKDHAKETRMQIDLPGKGDKLVSLGKAPEVVYLSNKWDGVMRSYKHQLKKHGDILALIDQRTGRVKTLILANVDLNITERGLLG